MQQLPENTPLQPLINEGFTGLLGQAQLLQLIRDMTKDLSMDLRAGLAKDLLHGYLHNTKPEGWRWVFDDKQLDELWTLADPELKTELANAAIVAVTELLTKPRNGSNWDYEQTVQSFLAAATAWLTQQITPTVVTMDTLDRMKAKDDE